MFNRFCPVKSVRDGGGKESFEGNCPVSGKSIASPSTVTPAESTSKNIEKKSESGCPVQHSGDVGGGCPVKGQLNDKSPFVYNEKANDFEYNQQPLPGQTVKLATERAPSSIPKGDFTPTHQKEADKTWVYPSEQQYYSAMKRKGYNPDAKDVPTILNIHNMVNEKGWKQVLEWERLRGSTNPKLLKFAGRPTDASPKSYFMTYFLGYEPPFDRHDWVVERENKEQVRYVIDFYKGNNFKKGGSPLAIFLDVRPALDSVPALVDRLSYEWRMNFAPHTLPRSSLITAGKPKYAGIVDGKASK